MNTGVLLKAVIVGIAVAAPVGPVGLLCIQRTLAHGRNAGLATGLGAAAADAAYAAVVAFGLGLVADLLVSHQGVFRVIGGACLVAMGVRTFLTKRTRGANRTPMGGLKHFSRFWTGFVLTLTNPLTMLAFAALFASLDIVARDDLMTALAAVGGVYIGSVVWWFFLSTAAGLLRTRISDLNLLLVHRVSGVVIFFFGLGVLVSVVGAGR